MRRGIRRFLIPAITLIFLTGCGYAGPEKAVRQELDLIRQLDESAIRSFLTDQDPDISDRADELTASDMTESIRLFFKNFTYRIRSSSMAPDKLHATVRADITNLDARALAKDLCRTMILQSSHPDGSALYQADPGSSFSLLKECLEKNTYETVTSSVTVSLTLKNNTWVIDESDALENDLTGGLIGYLSDPYLLEPEEVLEITLSPFRTYSAKDWVSYLEMNDVFSTGSSLASQIDLTLASQIARYFDYHISEVTQDGDTAAAVVDLVSLDLEAVLAACRPKLLDYAATTESIRASDEELMEKTAEILLEALQNNNTAKEIPVSVTLTNNGYSWEASLNDAFTDALLGGVAEAADELLTDS